MALRTMIASSSRIALDLARALSLRAGEHHCTPFKTMTRQPPWSRLTGLTMLFGVLWPVAASSQQRCAFLCVPDVKLEPTVTIEPAPPQQRNGTSEETPASNNWAPLQR